MQKLEDFDFHALHFKVDFSMFLLVLFDAIANQNKNLAIMSCSS